MMSRRTTLAGLGAGLLSYAALRTALGGRARAAQGSFPYHRTDAEWRKQLTPQQFAVLREEDTERPFTSKLLNEHRKGTFTCAGCDQAAFASDTKFDSGTGWPSFWKPLDKAVGTTTDMSLGMQRTEVHCSNCGGHFGHVFDDGPQPTGLRYCMNGLALGFKPATA